MRKGLWGRQKGCVDDKRAMGVRKPATFPGRGYFSILVWTLSSCSLSLRSPSISFTSPSSSSSPGFSLMSFRQAVCYELFSILTRPLTTTFTSLSIFSPLEISSRKIWESIRSWHAKCSLPVAVRVSKTRVLKFPKINGFEGDSGRYLWKRYRSRQLQDS